MNISLLTYNCHLFGKYFCLCKLNYNDKLRCRKIINLIEECNVDIVCLQEVWSHKLSNYIINELAFIYDFSLIFN